MILQYNKFMGGVDLADNMLANYCICIRGKKWWWRIFFNYIDVCMVNKWKLWVSIHHQEKVSLLDFRRQVTVKLLNSARFPSYVTGRPSAFALENSRPRNSTLQHFLRRIFCNKRRSCRQFHSQTRFPLWDV